MMRSLVPYFILAVGIIITFRLVSEIGFFSEIFGRFWATIAPFLTGAIIAYIMNMPCCAIQRLLEKTGNNVIIKRSRGISVLILIIITLGIITLMLNWIIPAAYSSIVDFIGELSRHEQTFRGWIATLNEWGLLAFLNESERDGEIDGLIALVMDTLQNFDFENLPRIILAGFGSTFSALFHTFLAIVSSIYLLMEVDKLRAFAMRLTAAITSARTNEVILKYSRKLNFNFRQYIYTQTIDGLILGGIMTVFLMLVVRSPHFLILGLILGILNYIPYFGSIVGTAIAVIVIAFTQGFPTAAWAALIMFAIQQLDGNFIQPRLMGGSFSLSPLLVIISVTVGGVYGGIIGMLVAIPIVALLKDIIDSYIEYREKKNKEEPLIYNDDFMNRDVW
jgi:predicted PurR-regulated permease PerM